MRHMDIVNRVPKRSKQQYAATKPTTQRPLIARRQTVGYKRSSNVKMLILRLLPIARLILFGILGSTLLFVLMRLGGIITLVSVAALTTVALIRKMDSRFMFVLALLSLIYAGCLQLLSFNASAQSLASDAYILLTAATVLLIFEVRRKNKFGFPGR